MSAPGRKPTPTKLRLLRGNPGKRPLPQGEPTPRVAAPAAPSHVSREAKREWRRTAKLLVELGLLTHVDRAALAMYCEAWGRWVEAEHALQEYGLIVKSPSGYPMQSPYLAVANRAMDQVRLLLGEFGMSPASRTRVQALEPAEDDAFERLLRGGRRRADADA
jgi:P27 family predicted phage terminase small subunit